MIKRDELAKRTSCLNRASDDEPIFVLRANDENAPAIVSVWARDYIDSKGGWNNMSSVQKKKYTDAMNVASSMRIWKMHHHQRAVR